MSAEAIAVNTRGLRGFTQGGLKILRRIVDGNFGERRMRFGKRWVERCGCLKSLSRQTQRTISPAASHVAEQALSFEQFRVSLLASLARGGWRRLFRC